MIPFVLHQIWLSGEPPADQLVLRDSFRRFNPTLDMRFHDDAAAARLVRDAFPDLVPLFESLAFPVLKADLFRLVAVLHHGGFYADMDMECLAPLDHLSRHDHAIFGVEAKVTRIRQRELGYAQPYQLANCIFAAPPGHPFVRALLDHVVAELTAKPVTRKADVENTTGPRAVTRFFYARRPADVRVLKQIYWVPPDGYADFAPLAGRILCRHHFKGSWKDTGEARSLKRRLIERNRLPNPYPRSPWHDFGFA